MNKETSSKQKPNTQYPIPKTLITGGAGFLGSHLCDKLIAEGHQVICVDNLLTGSRENIAHLLDDENFIFIEHDVTQPIDLEALILKPQHPKPNTQDLNYVLHFASPASPVDFIRYPIQTAKVGALGTHNALGLAKAKGAKFLLASTSEVYGDASVSPQKEEYWGNVNPVGPRGVYDEAKRFAEALTMAYHRQHGIDTKIARIFNTYGPRMRQDDGRVIPTFVVQALNNEPLTVFGDGSQTRSFCYVSDLIEGIYKLMLSDINEPVNLGNPKEITISELAKEILRVTESKSEIAFKPLPENDPKVRRPDISKAEKLLGWEPKVGLDEGLKKTIDHLSERGDL